MLKQDFCRFKIFCNFLFISCFLLFLFCKVTYYLSFSAVFILAIFSKHWNGHQNMTWNFTSVICPEWKSCLDSPTPNCLTKDATVITLYKWWSGHSRLLKEWVFDCVFWCLYIVVAARCLKLTVIVRFYDLYWSSHFINVWRSSFSFNENGDAIAEIPKIKEN